MPTEDIRYGQLESADWVVILLYLVASVGLGISFARRGSKDMDAYFGGSGAIPWWIAGTSLLVACFAADTPLWIGDIIYKRGLEGAWFYWAPAIGTAFFVLIVAPLWKRCGILTDIELLEVRYTGKAASAMRLLNSVFYSMFASIMFLGLQTLSIVKILGATTDWSKATCVLVTMVIATSYSLIAGLWGVAMSGSLQFFVTYIGSVILAFYAVMQFGDGPSALVGSVHALGEQWPQGYELRLLPSQNPWGLPAMTLFALFFFRWIEQAGMGQYVAQRLIATKDALSSVYTAMIWGIGFFAVVPLPWIVTVVAAKVVLPDLTAGDEAYPRMAMLLPVGLKGVLIASMLAAFMSTYSSLLSWGSSYAINDLYRRFLVPAASEKHYVRAGQIYMIPMALIAGGLALYADSLLNIIFVILSVMCGYWTVMVMRWVWWRVNAWSEVVGLGGSIAASLVSCVLPATRHWWYPDNMETYFGHRMVFIMLTTLVAWVGVTLATRPVSEEVLDRFYQRVRPPGWWRPVRERLGLAAPLGTARALGCWCLMLVAIYGPLIGLVKLAFGDLRLGIPCTVVGGLAIVGAVLTARGLYGTPRSDVG